MNYTIVKLLTTRSVLCAPGCRHRRLTHNMGSDDLCSKAKDDMYNLSHCPREHRFIIKIKYETETMKHNLSS